MTSLLDHHLITTWLTLTEDWTLGSGYNCASGLDRTAGVTSKGIGWLSWQLAVGSRVEAQSTKRKLASTMHKKAQKAQSQTCRWFLATAFFWRPNFDHAHFLTVKKSVERDFCSFFLLLPDDSSVLPPSPPRSFQIIIIIWPASSRSAFELRYHTELWVARCAKRLDKLKKILSSLLFWTRKLWGAPSQLFRTTSQS